MTMQNRRAHPRYGVRIDGRLMSADMSFSVNVIITNLSEDGATIMALAPVDTIPERAYLWQARTQTLFECDVQWRRKPRVIGVYFTEGCNRTSVHNLLEATVPAYAAEQVLKRCPTLPLQRAG